jgi:hypothetical protein
MVWLCTSTASAPATTRGACMSCPRAGWMMESRTGWLMATA